MQSSDTVHCESPLSLKMQQWLSKLKPFAQLSVCHGVLAKLPPPLLLDTEMEGRPLLVSLFPKVCKLFARYAYSLRWEEEEGGR